MGFLDGLSNPKILYITRCVQLAFSIGFLILVCYSGTHRGWWTNITPALAIGVITSIFTFAVVIHTIWIRHRSNPFSGRGSTYTIIRLVVEALIFLLWVATAALMLRPKGGCDQSLPDDNGVRWCSHNDGKDKYPWRPDDRPQTQWDIGIAFDFVLIVSFLASILFVWKDDRENKVSEGGVSYA